MLERKRGGMEEVTLQGGLASWLVGSLCGGGRCAHSPQGTRRAVQGVTYYRMPKRGQVHPDLVRAARFDVDLDQGKVAERAGMLFAAETVFGAETLHYAPVTDGWTRTAFHTAAGGHADPPHRIAPDG